MREYVVDCELRPLKVDGAQVVVPYTTYHHVHEQIIRCRDCRFSISPSGSCICTLRSLHHYRTKPDGYCDKGLPREDDG